MRNLSERVARYVWHEDEDVEFYSAPSVLSERLLNEYESKLALLFPCDDYDDSYDHLPFAEPVSICDGSGGLYWDERERRFTKRTKRNTRFISKRKEVK